MLEKPTGTGSKEKVSLCLRHVHRETGVASKRVLQMKSAAKVGVETLKQFVGDTLDTGGTHVGRC